MAVKSALAATRGQDEPHWFFPPRGDGDDPRAVAFLDVRELVIDQSVQRPVDPADPRFGEWDWNRAEVPTVTRRADGMLVVTEGQHRVLHLQGLRQASGSPLRIWVVVTPAESDGAAGEASTALGIATGRRGHTPAQRWDLRLRRGDPHEKLADTVLAKYGASVTGSGPAKSSGIRAVAALTSIVRGEGRNPQQGQMLLDAVMHVLTTAFDAGDPDRFDGHLLRAVAGIIWHNPHVRYERMAATLGRRPAAKWVLVAKASDRYGPSYKQLAGVVIADYNKGLKQAAGTRLTWE